MNSFFPDILNFTFDRIIYFKLFLALDYVRSKSMSAWDLQFLFILTIKFIFYTIDLLFTFSPANQLKQELHKTGKVIYTAALIKSPRNFQQSVKLLFPIYLAA